jgi:hypothetical protein
MRPGTSHPVLLVSVAVLSAIFLAVPAHATFTPTGGVISVSSSNTQFQQGGFAIRCPTSTATGTIDANGLGITLRVLFSENPTTRTTCTETLLGSSVAIRTAGRISIVSQSSTSGVSASSDLVVPAGSSVEVRSLAGTRTYGAQTVRNCITFNQASQTFNFRCTIVDTGGNTSTFTGSYSITVGVPLTVS